MDGIHMKPTTKDEAANQVHDAFDLLRRDAKGPSRGHDLLYLPADLLLGPDNPLSKARVRLWLAVRDGDGFDSLDALALALNRNKAHVSRDVSLLERLGLVKTIRHGAQKSIRAAAQAIEIV